MNDQSPMGHNQGPAFNPDVVEQLTEQAQEVSATAAEWANTEVSDDETAAKLKDFLDSAKKLQNGVEARRKEEKQPFLDAGREVDKAFKTVHDIIQRAGELAKGPLAKYLAQKEREAEEQRRKEAEEARRKQEEAERERQIAENNKNAAAQLAAEEKAKEAAEEAKAAEAPAKAKIGSATGTGSKATSLRTVRSAKITSINQAILHFREHPDVRDVILRLANAEIRASKGADITIPGIEVVSEKKL